MERPALQQALLTSHEEMVSHIDGLSKEAYEFRKDGTKWNAGQEVLHIAEELRGACGRISDFISGAEGRRAAA